MVIQEIYGKNDQRVYEEVDKLRKFMLGQSQFEGSYDDIYNLSHEFIYKIVYNIVKTKEAAEYLVQDVYPQIYNNMYQLKDPKDFYTYACRNAMDITYGFVASYYSQYLSYDYDGYSEDFPFNKIEEDQEKFIPANILNDKNIMNSFFSMIDKMSIPHKIVMIYFYIAKISVTQISIAMDYPEDRVRALLSYVRKTIRNAVIVYYGNSVGELCSLNQMPIFMNLIKNSVIGEDELGSSTAVSVYDSSEIEMSADEVIIEDEISLNLDTNGAIGDTVVLTAEAANNFIKEKSTGNNLKFSNNESKLKLADNRPQQRDIVRNPAMMANSHPVQGYNVTNQTYQQQMYSQQMYSQGRTTKNNGVMVAVCVGCVIFGIVLVMLIINFF